MERFDAIGFQNTFFLLSLGFLGLYWLRLVYHICGLYRVYQKRRDNSPDLFILSSDRLSGESVYGCVFKQRKGAADAGSEQVSGRQSRYIVSDGGVVGPRSVSAGRVLGFLLPNQLAPSSTSPAEQWRSKTAQDASRPTIRVHCNGAADPNLRHSLTLSVSTLSSTSRSLPAHVACVIGGSTNFLLQSMTIGAMQLFANVNPQHQAVMCVFTNEDCEAALRRGVRFQSRNYFVSASPPRGGEVGGDDSGPGTGFGMVPYSSRGASSGEDDDSTEAPQTATFVPTATLNEIPPSHLMVSPDGTLTQLDLFSPSVFSASDTAYRCSPHIKEAIAAVAAEGPQQQANGEELGDEAEVEKEGEEGSSHDDGATRLRLPPPVVSSIRMGVHSHSAAFLAVETSIAPSPALASSKSKASASQAGQDLQTLALYYSSNSAAVTVCEEWGSSMFPSLLLEVAARGAEEELHPANVSRPLRKSGHHCRGSSSDDSDGQLRRTRSTGKEDPLLPVAMVMMYPVKYEPGEHTPLTGTGRRRVWFVELLCWLCSASPEEAEQRPQQETSTMVSLLYGATPSDVYRASDTFGSSSGGQVHGGCGEGGCDLDTAAPRVPSRSSFTDAGSQLVDDWSSELYRYVDQRLMHTLSAIDRLYGAAHREGLDIPLGLRYLRIQNELFLVTPVQDKSYVQFVETRHAKVRDEDKKASSPGDDDVREQVVRALRYSKSRKKKQRVAASTRSFSKGVYSFSDRNDGTQRKVQLCACCFSHSANTIMLPCADLIVCASCAEGCAKCPACQKEVESFLVLNSVVR